MNVCVSEMLKVLSVILIKDVGSYGGGCKDDQQQFNEL